MRARLLAPSFLLVAALAAAVPAHAATCALSAGTLAVPVGDGGTVVLLNDGTSIDVQGATDCLTPLAQITGGIAISGTSGDNTVEVRLHATVAYPPISFVLLGGQDAVDVVGSTGSDTLNVMSRFSGAGPGTSLTVDGGNGNDIITALGWPGGVRLLGGSGDDVLTGTNYTDSIDGGPNDDTIAGRYGADVLEGGLGADDVDYALSGGAVKVVLNSASNSGGDAAGDVLSGFEGVIGSPYGDTLTGSVGGDTLLGNSGDDVLAGRGGADLLGGGSGADTATYLASPMAVQVALGLGAGGGDATGDELVGIENVIGSAFGDRLTGDDLANRLAGGSGNDTIVAAGGNDVLLGGPGNDLLDGGAGIDTVSYEGTAKQIAVDLVTSRATGDGTDTLRGIENATGGRKGDSLVGDGRANVLSGGGGADTLSGGGGADRLLGGAAADQLLGGAGADYLDGGKGTDRCDGEADTDTYKACDGTGKP